MESAVTQAGHQTATPYLVVPGVERLVDFLKEAFEARELGRMLWPDTTIMRITVRIGDSVVLLGEPFGDVPPVTGAVYFDVDDVDAVFARALAAGAAPLREPVDELHGERVAGVKDAVGNVWWLASKMEELSPEEIAIRMNDAEPEAGAEG